MRSAPSSLNLRVDLSRFFCLAKHGDRGKHSNVSEIERKARREKIDEDTLRFKLDGAVACSTNFSKKNEWKAAPQKDVMLLIKNNPPAYTVERSLKRLKTAKDKLLDAYQSGDCLTLGDLKKNEQYWGADKSVGELKSIVLCKSS